MIPNPKTSDCHNYYNAICKAVVGCNVRDTEGLARRLATYSNYNLLRAPMQHGNYFDHKPCWILVPACSLQDILDWKKDATYPVLAVANRCGATKAEDAYLSMCTLMYNDTHDNSKYLKRSKCKKDEFVNATKNLRAMTLAMAETLIGNKECKFIRPDKCLQEKKIDMTDEVYQFISKRLNDRTADEEKGGEKSPGTEGSKIPKTWYDAVQFSETRKSLGAGIKLPKEAKEGPDPTRGEELLQFVVDPDRLDLYPDPMLLLIKAAVNWSWSCGQKLLPACGCANEEEEEEEELVVPSTPVPTMIEFQPVPVTPDDNDDASLSSIVPIAHFN